MGRKTGTDRDAVTRNHQERSAFFPSCSFGAFYLPDTLRSERMSSSQFPPSSPTAEEASFYPAGGPKEDQDGPESAELCACMAFPPCARA